MKQIEVTAANGTKYQFTEVELFKGCSFIAAYFLSNGKWNKMSARFGSIEEAQAWVEEMNARHLAQKNAPKTSPNMNGCADWYSKAPAGTYFGD